MNKLTLAPLALVLNLSLTACGGGGSSPAAPTPASSLMASSSTPASSLSTSSRANSTSSEAGSSSSNAAINIDFINASVHDPSVLKVGSQYYVFGSHLAAAKTSDLMNWSKVADGVNNQNPLFGNKVTSELALAFSWSQVTGLWAADVIQLEDGKFYMYYNTCKGDSPRSALGVAVSDNVEGPYINKQIMLKSGMWGEVSEDGNNIYDALVHPNAVDPDVFFDKNGNLWMIYGSYSGGIFILELDKTSGLVKPGQGYGKHLLGGNHARIEGAYVLYNHQTNYYYMFSSFGGLDANGAYNIRVARATNPDGPYYDATGTEMTSVKGNPTKLFDDPLYAPHGQKLMGNFQFALTAGETGTAYGYVSAGHNSAYYDTDKNQYFLFFHTRFPSRGEQHEIRVHELFFNAEGWPVVAPYRYVPLASNPAGADKNIALSDISGNYKYINHGKDISTAIKTSININLSNDGTISGAVSGTWLAAGDNQITLAIGNDTYEGVVSRQWNPNTKTFVVTFSAQSNSGVSIWGSQIN
ncbi:MAG TPA: glycoside hydrolase family 43 protein [Cellvibrio sp.]|nr:glycoside hydrolase family 43 protein [Cellvibrio sp.]